MYQTEPDRRRVEARFPTTLPQKHLIIDDDLSEDRQKGRESRGLLRHPHMPGKMTSPHKKWAILGSG